MALDTQLSLAFEVDGAQPDLTPVRFRGIEEISRLYRFEIDFVSDDDSLDLDALLLCEACLTVSADGRERLFTGVIVEAEEGERTATGAFRYRLVLMPRLALLDYSRQSQIFGSDQPVTPIEVVRQELTGQDAAGPAQDSAARLPQDRFDDSLLTGFLKAGESAEGLTLGNHGYPVRDYIVQYRESDFAFVSRLLEHYGVFYYFRQTEHGECLVLGDADSCFAEVDGRAPVPFRPITGMAAGGSASIQRLNARHRPAAKKVLLRDYNWRQPSDPLMVEEVVDERGHGVIADYGDHFRSGAEGEAFARIRAEEARCRRQISQGQSDHPGFAAGHLLAVEDHFRPGANGDYLLVKVIHEGGITGYDDLGGLAAEGVERGYRNRFEAVRFPAHFRPARVTPKPQVTGLITGHVDGSADTDRAQIDDYGQYRVRLPFDLRGAGDGKASRYVRKAEPYGGAKNAGKTGHQGMHFPLVKGTEVVLSCINGDPDRPVIAGAMPNAQARSMVNTENHTKNMMRTSSGIRMEFDDRIPPGGDGGGGGAQHQAGPLPDIVAGPLHASAGADPLPAPQHLSGDTGLPAPQHLSGRTDEQQVVLSQIHESETLHLAANDTLDLLVLATGLADYDALTGSQTLQAQITVTAGADWLEMRVADNAQKQFGDALTADVGASVDPVTLSVANDSFGLMVNVAPDAFAPAHRTLTLQIDIGSHRSVLNIEVEPHQAAEVYVKPDSAYSVKRGEDLVVKIGVTHIEDGGASQGWFPSTGLPVALTVTDGTAKAGTDYDLDSELPAVGERVVKTLADLDSELVFTFPAIGSDTADKAFQFDLKLAPGGADDASQDAASMTGAVIRAGDETTTLTVLRDTLELEQGAAAAAVAGTELVSTAADGSETALATEDSNAVALDRYDPLWKVAVPGSSETVYPDSRDTFDSGAVFSSSFTDSFGQRIVSYQRRGAPDRSEAIEELYYDLATVSSSNGGDGKRLASLGGSFDYVDGDRVEWTTGNRDIIVQGAHRTYIAVGGTNVWDATPLYYRKIWQPDGSNWMTTVSEAGDSQSVSSGSSYSVHAGSNFSASVTADSSVSLSLSTAISGSLSSSVDLGVSLQFGVGYSYSFVYGSSIDHSASKSLIADNVVDLHVKRQEPDAKAKTKSLVKAGTLAGAGLAGGLVGGVIGGIYSRVEADQEDSSDQEKLRQIHTAFSSSELISWGIFTGLAVTSAIQYWRGRTKDEKATQIKLDSANLLLVNRIKNSKKMNNYIAMTSDNLYIDDDERIVFSHKGEPIMHLSSKGYVTVYGDLHVDGKLTVNDAVNAKSYLGDKEDIAPGKHKPWKSNPGRFKKFKIEKAVEPSQGEGAGDLPEGKKKSK